MEETKVSIAVLAQGKAIHLRRAIDSILAQSYQNIEILVVYTGPVEDKAVKETVLNYGDKIKYYRKEDTSVAASLNFAINNSAGQYFSWLSQDDTYLAEKIDKEIRVVNSNKNMIAISGWFSVNQNNRKLSDYVIDNAIEKHPACFLAFTQDTRLNTCAMLFPIAILGSNPFNESLPAARDYKLLNSLIIAGAKIKLTNGSLLSYSTYSEDRYLSDSMISNDNDLLRSEFINTVSYEAILDYFGSRENATRFYKDSLDSSQPRCAAFLMQKIIIGSMDLQDHEAAKATLLEDLSGLVDSNMATKADSLLSKILQPSAKKKIMFCSAQWLTGGMERVMSTLFRELANDYEIFLITPHDVTESHIDIPDHVISIKISNEHFTEYFDVMILTYALLLDMDVVIGFFNLFSKQLNAYKLCVGTKIKTIASNHEYYFYPYKSPSQYDVVEKRLSAYTKSDAIVWPNSFNAALCGMYVENSYVIGNPNNFEIVQNIIEAKENVIICVGRFNDYVKRIDRILRCFSLVLEKVPDAKLVLVGKYDKDARIRPNENTSINSIITDLALPTESLSFVGEVSNVQDYYAKAKVLMLTSNSEGFGMVLNEAACFGVPSVCNYIPGIEDIIIDGENGYITEQDDLVSMATKVSSILKDQTLHNRLSVNARKDAKSFDAKHIGDKWRYLINSLTEMEDKNVLHKKLNEKLGYRIQDQLLITKVLSRELNEIFYMSIDNANQRRITNGTLLVLNKAVRIPKRLKANIEYEGLRKTSSKIATRSFRIARNKLKI